MKIKMIGKIMKVTGHPLTLINIIRGQSAVMTIIDLINNLLMNVSYNKTKKNCFMDKMSSKERNKENMVDTRSPCLIIGGHIEAKVEDKMRTLRTYRMKTRKTLITKNFKKIRIAASMKVKRISKNVSFMR